MWDCGSSSAHAQPPPPRAHKMAAVAQLEKPRPSLGAQNGGRGAWGGGGLRDPPTIPSSFTKKPRIFPLFVVLEADFPFFGSFRRGILLTEAAEAHPGAALCPPPPPIPQTLFTEKKNPKPSLKKKSRRDKAQRRANKIKKKKKGGGAN